MTGSGNVRVAFIDHGSGVQHKYSVSFSLIISIQSQHNMMMMFFHFGIDDTILIKGWKAHNAGG